MRVERFLKAAEHRHPAVVLGVANAASLVIVRNLSAVGVPLLALDPDPGAPGLHSRLAAGRLCPDPAADEEALLLYLEQLGAQLPQRAVLFPADDRFVLPLSRSTVRLRPWYFVPIAPWEATQRFYETPALVDTAERSDVPVLESRATVGELVVFASYLDAQSRPLAQFTGRGVHEHPAGSGRVSLAESIWLRDLADVGLRLLHHAGYQGVSQAEFRRDPNDGRFRLTKVGMCDEPWLSLAAACGVDLPLAAYRDAIGEPYLTPHQSEGLKRVMPLADVREGLARWRDGREGPGSWLRSYRGTASTGLATPLNDPLPGMLRMWRRLQSMSERDEAVEGRVS